MPGDGVRHLTLDEVLEIHRRLIEAFGGPAGIRDHGLLESALYRPRTGYYEELAGMAAALFESLLMNHCFVDGNKRVAFFATDIFLRLNGWQFSVEPEAAHDRLIGLRERGEADFERLESLDPCLRGASLRRDTADAILRQVERCVGAGKLIEPGALRAAPASTARTLGIRLTPSLRGELQR